METGKYYHKEFYTSEAAETALQSPRQVVPLVVQLITPHSVVDVGCGNGAWLSVFREYGVERILGIEGGHVNPRWLLIPEGCLAVVDLSRRFRLQESFDLAVCLEVAEHLPKKCADGFVESLVSLAPVLLFSAAVPLQGGVHHINEQWPEYWAGKFRQRNYRQVDIVRKEIWKNASVKYCYRQNIFLYVREDVVSQKKEFVEAEADSDDLLLVHHSIIRRQLSLGSILKSLPRSVCEFAARRLAKLRSRAERSSTSV